MEINFNGQTNMSGTQIGDNNTMNIYSNKYETVFKEETWKELDIILKKQLEDNTLNKTQNSLVYEGLKYVEKRDEHGFKKFLIKNKNSFLMNVLSNLASSGLSIFLNQLIDK